MGEVFSSPGPRKKAHEDNTLHSPELAEDSGGVLMLDGHTSWMWVADGASDMHALGGFSSRFLAQELGRHFIAGILDLPQSTPVSSADLSVYLGNTIRLTVEAWSARLQHDADLTSSITQKLEAWQTQSGGTGNASVFFEFASTFSAVCLNGEGHLTGISVGDSYMLSNPNGLLEFFALKKGAVTLRLKLENGSPVFSVAVPPEETFEHQGVNLAVLATDGTRETFQHLQKVLPPEFFFSPKNFAGFRKALGSAVPKTQDDKTLAWLGLIHAG